MISGLRARRAERLVSNASVLLFQARSTRGRQRRLLLQRSCADAERGCRLLRDYRNRAEMRLWLESLTVSAMCMRELGEIEIALNQFAARVALDMHLSPSGASSTSILSSEMSLCYRQIGMPDRAAAFLCERLRLASHQPHEETPLANLLAGLFDLDRWLRGHKSARAELYLLDGPVHGDIKETLIPAVRRDIDAVTDRLAREHADSPLAQAVLLLSRQRLGTVRRPAGAIAEVGRALLDAWPDYADTWPFMAAELCVREDRETAYQLLRDAADHARESGGPPWQSVRIVQQLAHLSLRDDPAEALRLALESWAVMDELRYRTQSARLRAGIFRSYAPARRVAMQAAVLLQDWRVLTELLEACRLQGFASMVGDRAQTETLLRNWAPAAARSAPDTMPERQPEGVDVPEPFSYPADDCLGESGLSLASPADILVDGVSELARTRERISPELNFEPIRRRVVDTGVLLESMGPGHDRQWLSTWQEGRRIFWVSNGPALREGGSLDLGADTDLARALARCRRALEPTADGPPAAYDLLIHAGTEERGITVPLSRLLPEPLRDRRPGEPRGTLFLSGAPDLACVPWPILPLGDDTEAARLIDVVDLHFLPSLSVLERAISLPPAGPRPPGPLPLNLSCDYFPEDARVRPPRAAAVRLGGPRQCERYPGVRLATGGAVLSRLASTGVNEWGLSVFRGHYRSVRDVPTSRETMDIVDGGEDPNQSGFELHDEVLPAAALAGVDRATGRPLLGMTSHVILACCSSTAIGARAGGESLGLLAGCFQSGADHVVGTAIDIAACTFTDRLIDLLVDAARERPYEYPAAVNDVQRAMLARWREESRAGSMAWSGTATTSPVPFVWAYFQAFGIPPGVSQEGFR